MKRIYRAKCNRCGFMKEYSGSDTIKKIEIQMKDGIIHTKCLFCGNLMKLIPFDME